MPAVIHAVWWWLVTHAEPISLLAVPVLAWAVVLTTPTAADVTRRERP